MRRILLLITMVIASLYSFSQDYKDKLPGEWSKWITVYEDSVPGTHHKIQISFNLAHCGQSDYHNFNDGESYYRVKSDFRIPKVTYVFTFIYVQCDTTEVTEEVSVDLHRPVFDDNHAHHFAGQAVKSLSPTGKMIAK